MGPSECERANGERVLGNPKKNFKRRSRVPGCQCSVPASAGASFEEGAKLAASRWMAQLAQRLGFDLPDALARHREALADFLERVLAAVAHAEAHLDHFLFPRRERLQHRLGLL